jgi:hypothetical protein
VPPWRFAWAAPVMILGAAAVWLSAWASGPACAEAPAGSNSGVEQASYTTGEQGGRLKWLPHRGQAPMVAGRTVASPPPTRPEPPYPLKQVAAHSLAQGSSDPFRDPFEEGPAALRAPASLGQLPTDPTRALPTEPALIQPAIPNVPGIPDVFAPRDLPAEPVPAEPMPREAPTPRASGTYVAPPNESRGRHSRPDPLGLGCPSPNDPRFHKSIHQLTTDITPPDLALDLPLECELDDETMDPNRPRPWAPTTFTWKASGLCHKPLYFEQVHAERYGHSWGPLVQPVMAHAHFFLTVPVLPYKMGLTPPKECMYTLGYYRPGNCAPYMLDPLPLSVRAAAWQAGAVLGAVYILP